MLESLISINAYSLCSGGAKQLLVELASALMEVFSKAVASDQPFALIVCDWEVNNLLGPENS
ncbi:hypothetical protein EV14_2242 [Prochlorococcus sp. MIT 0703]|nr:hypothetical protein EV14_2242 [Prochlorococcus sp. MIT 0703]